MDLDHVAGMLRTLATTPSRRTVTRGLVGLAAGSVLAPLLRLSEADANGKGRKRGRRRKRRNKDKVKPKPPQCPAKTALCTAGNVPECCSTVVEPGEEDPNEICTECGCCDRGYTYCCPGRDELLCCKNSDRCAYGPDFQPFCCPPDWTTCGPIVPCCAPGSFCCPNGGCCSDGATCCPNGGCAYPPTLPCPA
jgi:hypothetical protein